MDKSQEESLKNIRSFFIKSISGHGGTLLIAAYAEALSAGLSNEEINALSSFISGIGQLMSYIAAQRKLIESCDQNNKTVTISIDNDTVILKGKSGN